MRRSLAAALLAGLFLALPGAARAMNDWTVVIYQCADDTSSSTLEDAAIRDLCELDAVGSTDRVEFVAQVDRGTKLSALMKQTYDDPDYSGATRYRIGKGRWAREAKLGEVNMGSPEALWDCLSWVAEKHPARHYFLVLAGHGSGVFSWRGFGAVSHATPGGVAFPPRRFVAYDSTDDDCLTVFEVSRVLAEFRDRLNEGRRVDVMAFDSCLACNVEVLYQFREVVDVMVASASTVPMCGLDYGVIARTLARDPATTGEALAAATVKGFIDAAPCQGKGDIMGAFRTSAAQNLAGSLSRLSLELLRAMRETGRGFGVKDLVAYNERYYDVKRLAEALGDARATLNGASNAEAVREAAREVLADRTAATVSLWYGGTYATQKAGGLSLAWPSKDEWQKYRSFYRVLDFARDTQWDEVLDRRELGVDPGN